MTTRIEKENIPKLNFIPAETDNSKKWKTELNYAVRLGNEHKGKTAITFVSEEGIFQVETTIWSVTETELSLKGGIHIPLKSITDIHF
ncbi:MAG: hypothetical protein V4561_13875 [Bacteroidota bacterium]|jgi:hypothetical protein